ncbi:hypothetical protein A3K34_00780 [candidate division WWE3 bacterium RIFOXYC1_FULL_40_10]|uniref:PDZ domain-containing protein n=1 Tax=candidate division WWE3 bacterium RIFOXYA2_FULL_46_9 TaxID=1802636 RepID=A0A1F4W2S4_UNCKA|nr:MAG: hypothetical protein A3K58_00780 [candidate division WWE3 bacterium RIFOXYB1_FULL_40_22]OGC61410.1 MAG: hypothetical protein A3K37_00780 [candidate division WWE3 bacterium RIFOXYA1_FULL_40_11]OGC63343.1 MAG: hypothetical protein A2264_01255 [candidate division WWE3 bacterium RIFOXYA2_FULL_46_9]OGC65400.1 MAG: hypothetical protein A2326_05065 [candidate division WWE3 bacterium RIFOXYB2_FULL_41_6]OGC65793.1 MAG: hypothetical protein A3K34_00780 [candidate division WWE3 bacterium RIFOXYC1_
MTVIIFIIMLSILVLVHEFGHFIIAKLNGIRVEEFGMGLPPKLVSVKRGETAYSINLLPFGGFVKLTGEETTISSTNDPRSFASKSVGQRAAVLLAGVVMNVMLALVLFYAYFLLNNFKTSQMPLFFDHKFTFGNAKVYGTLVADVVPGYPAEKAGIKPGEIIVTVDNIEVKDVAGLREAIKNKEGKELTVVTENIGNPDFSDGFRSVTLVPQLSEEGVTSLGVYLTDTAVISYDSFLERVFVGPLHSYNVLSYSIGGMANILGVSIEEKSVEPLSQSVAGPVGIFRIVDTIVDIGGRRAVLVMLDFMGLMSLSLAFLNVMPFPALDGGRLLFVVIEGIAGRRINPKIEMLVHQVGMMFLLGLLVLITIKDLFI